VEKEARKHNGDIFGFLLHHRVLQVEECLTNIERASDVRIAKFLNKRTAFQHRFQNSATTEAANSLDKFAASRFQVAELEEKWYKMPI
jgi:hypothetical protein